MSRICFGVGEGDGQAKLVIPDSTSTYKGWFGNDFAWWFKVSIGL